MFETVAVPVSDDDHVTESVMLAVVKFEYVPVAVNCSVLPWAMEAVAGVTEMLRSVVAPAGSLVRGSMAPITTADMSTSGSTHVTSPEMPRLPPTHVPPNPHV